MSELVPEIEVRRAKRALSEKKIPSEVVGRIMTAATYAPSCLPVVAFYSCLKRGRLKVIGSRFRVHGSKIIKGS